MDQSTTYRGLSAVAGSDQRSARNYRPDIDGLRALAVLPIVGFHLGAHRVGGGYIGVDIFFVISGYLIGGAVLTQMLAGGYSIGDFYARRFRRIVPALVAMLLLTTLAMCILGLPQPLLDYGKSLVAAMLSVSNVYFLQTSGYFDAAADSKPLLHTWSLAVEEQFYLLFPLLILPLRRFGYRAVLGVLALLATASLAASCIGVQTAPLATFYLLPTRIWELLLGALASQIRRPVFGPRLFREAAALAGLAAVLAPIAVYSSKTPFPGLAAIPPCVGTAVLLVVGAQGDSLVGRGLALRPAVFFGLISYSLYLWHWPVIVLLKESLPVEKLTGGLRWAALGLSIALGWLSWRYVERPWRRPSITPPTIFGAAGLAASAVCALGLALVILQGLPGRFAPEVASVSAYLDYPHLAPKPKAAFGIAMADRFEDYDPRACLDPVPGKPNLILMGDSYAGHLRSGLAARFPNLHVREATATGGCKPFPGDDAGDRPACRQLRRFMFDTYLASRPGDWVLLAANWRGERDAKPLGETIDWLRARGLHVIVAGPMVGYRMPLPKLMALALARGDDSLVRRFRNPGGSQMDLVYAAIAQAHGAAYLSTYRSLCTPQDCLTAAADGAPVQWDRGHLTDEGAQIVVARLPVDRIAAAR